MMLMLDWAIFSFLAGEHYRLFFLSEESEKRLFFLSSLSMDMLISDALLFSLLLLLSWS